MTIATDPNSVSSTDSDDDFDKHFAAFAAGKPVPEEEAQGEEVPPEGNGPADEEPAPAPPEPATEEAPAENATSGEATTEAAPPEAAEAAQAPDPWANASPELIAERDRLQRERDEAQHRAQSDASRVAALSRKLQALTMAPPSSAAPAPDPKATEAQKALDGKIEQLRKDYGDIAEPLIELIENQKQELDHVRTTLTGMSEVQKAQVIAEETAALTARHPDWQNIAKSDEWTRWLEIQPENIQRLANSWDARETSVALTLFKAEKVETTGQTAAPAPVATPPAANAATGARRSQQLEGGADVRSRPAPAASGPPEDFEAAFKYYEEKRRLKAQAGRV